MSRKPGETAEQWVVAGVLLSRGSVPARLLPSCWWCQMPVEPAAVEALHLGFLMQSRMTGNCP